MLCTSSSPDRDLCLITRESANEVCCVFSRAFFKYFLGCLDGFYFTGLG
ncbi:hypothetical protein [uncultured Gammaproteobacteria bacterium]|nr:hypothetical protein [uncultured Gammaproteobacteria bacterium]